MSRLGRSRLLSLLFIGIGLTGLLYNIYRQTIIGVILYTAMLCLGIILLRSK